MKRPVVTEPWRARYMAEQLLSVCKATDNPDDAVNENIRFAQEVIAAVKANIPIPFDQRQILTDKYWGSVNKEWQHSQTSPERSTSLKK